MESRAYAATQSSGKQKAIMENIMGILNYFTAA